MGEAQASTAARLLFFVGVLHKLLKSSAQMALIPLHPAAHHSRNTAPDGPASLVAGAGPVLRKKERYWTRQTGDGEGFPARKNFTTKLSLTTLGTGLARTGTNTKKESRRNATPAPKRTRG